MLSVLFSADDDARVSGIGIAEALGMAEKSLEERVAALEEKVGEQSIAEQFAEQGRLIDQALAYQLAQQDKTWDARLRRELERFETRLEKKLEAKLDKTLGAKLETTLDAKLENLEAKLDKTLDAKLEKVLDAKFEIKLAPIRAQLSDLNRDVKAILSRLR